MVSFCYNFNVRVLQDSKLDYERLWLTSQAQAL